MVLAQVLATPGDGNITTQQAQIFATAVWYAHLLNPCPVAGHWPFACDGVHRYQRGRLPVKLVADDAHGNVGLRLDAPF